MGYSDTAQTSEGTLLTEMLRFHQATNERPRIPKSAMFPKGSETGSVAPHIVGNGGTYANPRARRTQRNREASFERAVAFAHTMDLCPTVLLTISWDALLRTGDHNHGHCLGRGDRDAYLRRELNRLCRALGIAFAALWGRDVGREMGAHIHIAMFLPLGRTGTLERLVRLLERVTGSPAEFVLVPYVADTVARSTCGGWQIDVNRRQDAKASALWLAGYIATQDAKHPAAPKLNGKTFGVSEVLSRAAQRQAAPLLAAREAENGWIRSMTAPKD